MQYLKNGWLEKLKVEIYYLLLFYMFSSVCSDIWLESIFLFLRVVYYPILRILTYGWIDFIMILAFFVRLFRQVIIIEKMG